MGKNKITLKEAVKFHGHLGPYLVLGLLMGELALKELKCKKYFHLKVAVKGANKRPKSCLVDGLQLATGATYGKGNIRKLPGKNIEACVRNHKKKIKLTLSSSLIRELGQAKTHQDCEILAKKLYNRGEENGIIRS